MILARGLRSGCLALPLALVLVACGGEPPPPKAQPAQVCAQEWNQRAPAALRRQLDAVVTRDRVRRVRVTGSYEGTALADVGECFVAQASRRAELNHLFIQSSGAQWRVVTPRFPSGREAPMRLEKLVRDAYRYSNATVGPAGRVRIVARDRPRIGS